MIRNASEMQSEVRSKMRGGDGDIEITHIFTQEEIGGKCRLHAKITIPVGGSIGLHEHSGEAEVYYILQGKAQVMDAGVTRELSAGDAVLTGGGNSHSIRNSGDHPLTIIATIILS